MPAHKEASNDLAKQLHADAKEFVPSSVRDLCFHSSLDLSFLLMLCVMFGSPFQAILKATAAAWKPTDGAPKPANAVASSQSSVSGKALPRKNDATSVKSAAANPSGVDVV